MSQSFSKRLKTRLNFILIPFIAQILIRLIYWSAKKVLHAPSTLPDTPMVIAFWHGDLLMQNYAPKHLKTLSPKRPIAIIASEHKDGALIARAMNYFGIQTIAGSSSRGAAKALRNALQFLGAGGHVMITPDGPRGPRHSVANGTIIMAQKERIPILIHQCIPNRYWRINSWDQFIIPKPFCTLEFFIQEPLNLVDLPLEDAKKILHERLLQHAL
ncbi:MAG: hypothetical protein KU28_01585 [Sulfurovum sp. PC08-66]|nr:MAG: hypothetical protein KU28_01585 [Sulfurovum sp. PC08-66]KIM12633.1 MAG: hypothetical protein KU37_01700 [Sulfuricurvum sp. PC08-66]